jgi:hypothetical protein
MELESGSDFLLFFYSPCNVFIWSGNAQSKTPDAFADENNPLIVGILVESVWSSYNYLTKYLCICNVIK